MSFKIHVFVDGRESGTYEIRKGEECVIGREAGNDIVVLDRSVSRRHCKIRVRGDGLEMIDLGSANGIYYEGESHTRLIVGDGDQVSLGTARLQIINTATHTGMIPISGLLEALGESNPSSSSGDTSDSSISISDDFLRQPGTPFLFREPPEAVATTDSSIAAKPEYKALERDRLLMLVELGKSLGQSTELEPLLNRILDHLFAILPVRRAVIALTADGENFSARVTRPASEDLGAVASQGVLKQVVASREGRIIEDASLDHKLKSNMSVVASNIRAAVCTPIVVNDRCLGAIYADFPGRARLYSKSDLDFLTAFASIAGVSLENSRMTEQLRERDRLKRDLEIAAEIQQGILPNEAFHVEGFEIDWAYLPSLNVGGDFYDVIDLADGRLCVIIGDVSGKSVPAALYMSRTISFLRAVVGSELVAGEALTRTNQLLGVAEERVIFATAAIVVFDRKRQTIEWSSAGHNPILLRSPDTGQVTELDADGPPLGVVEGFEYETREVPLETGGIVTFYTDGLVEARSAEAVELGVERVNEIVTEYLNEPVGTMTKAMLTAIADHHAASAYVLDDVAIVNIRLL
ncbi:MAG: SpoIIE family protein phosphatase [Planctomycetota bacterium]